MSDQVEQLPIETTPPNATLVSSLKELFPGLIADGVIDAQRLSEAVGLPVARAKDEKERFGLMWAGKKFAVESLQLPSLAALSPEQSSIGEWDVSQDVFIEGDNLEVLKLLQKSYNDQVKLIYIDPPYNTGNDFVYHDDFSDTIKHYLEVTGQVNAEGNRLIANTETSGRKSSNWLSMMYPRLALARNLLHDEGLIFVSIDDYEVNSLKLLMDEIFGQSNYLSTLVWNRGHSQQQGIFKKYHEYVLVYARNSEKIKNFTSPEEGEVVAGAIKKISKANPESEFTFPKGVNCEAPDGTSFQNVWGDGEKVRLIKGKFRVMGGKTTDEMTLAAGWTQKNQMTAFFRGDEEVRDSKGQKLLDFYFSASGKLKYRKERTSFTPPSVQSWGTQGSASAELDKLLGGSYFDRPKPVGMLSDIISWTTSNDDIILDFFCGSGTTAHAVMLRNQIDGAKRRFILVNLPEATPHDSAARAAGYNSISDITRERLRKAYSIFERTHDNGIRFYKLDKSSFQKVNFSGDDSVPVLLPMTLTENFQFDNVVAEVLCKAGVKLSSQWKRSKLSGIDIVTVDNVCVVTSLDLTEELVNEAIKIPDIKSIVFLEDAFLNKDALKANLYFGLQRANINMKTV